MTHLTLGRGGVISKYSGRDPTLQGHHNYFLCRIKESLHPWNGFRLGIQLNSRPENDHQRWLMLVSNNSDEGSLNSLIGLDVKSDTITIGLFLPITSKAKVALDGDGAIVVTGDVQKPTSLANFKPSSIQGLWSLYTVLTRMLQTPITKTRPYSAPDPKRYSSILTSSRTEKNQWEYDADLWSKRPDRVQDQVIDDSTDLETKRNIRITLKFVMSKMDLDIATPKQIQDAVMEQMPGIELGRYKKYIDTEMLTVLGEMECSACILDFLFLGSEWNAANIDELKQNGITHILNVTKEIDNFHPDLFHYKNILLYDLDSSNLLDHWESTFKFIEDARKIGGRVLVHCKMGISRSGSTVCAYLMKQYGWDLEASLSHVQKCRPIANPNDGFIKQLQIYQGMLAAQIFREELDDGMYPSEAVSDTDVIDIQKSRVKKLVNTFHQREKAIRRSKSTTSKTRKPKSCRIGHIQSDDDNNLPRLVMSLSDDSSSNEFLHVRDISLSSVSEYPNSYVETSDVAALDRSHPIGSLSESESDHEPSTTDSVARLRRAGLVRLRTRQIEARLRRRKRRPRVLGVVPSLLQVKDPISISDHFMCHSVIPSRSSRSLSNDSCCLSEPACQYQKHIYQSVYYSV